MKFYCRFCEYGTINYKWLIRHMWDFHSLSQGFAVVCGISSCVKTFTNEKSILRHIKAKHEDFHSNQMKESILVGILK